MRIFCENYLSGGAANQDKTICARLRQVRVVKVVVKIFIIRFQESPKSVSPGNAGIFQLEMAAIKKAGE